MRNDHWVLNIFLTICLLIGTSGLVSAQDLPVKKGKKLDSPW